MKDKLTMTLLNGGFGVCKLDKNNNIPKWALDGENFSVTKTTDELSIVCSVDLVPEDVICEKTWKALKIEGTLDFSLIGILANISRILAEVSISIFSISTYNTDYILIKEQHTEYAIKALNNSGIEVQREKIHLT